MREDWREDEKENQINLDYRSLMLLRPVTRTAQDSFSPVILSDDGQ